MGKIQPLGKIFARTNYHLLVGKSKERKRIASNIKNNLNYPELCNASDYIEKNIPKAFQGIILGNPLPQNYEQLGFLPEIPYLGEKIDAELNSCLLGIRKYSYEINLFLTYKKEFETNLLIGNYKDAEKYISKVEQEICFSLWSLESRFVLLELSGKAPKSKELLNDFNKINDSHGVTKGIVHYLSLRAEKSLSINRYIGDLEMALGRIKLKNPDVIQAYKDFYRFKLTYLNHTDFENYAGILSLDFAHSIIDRYLNLTRLLTNLLAVSSYLNEEEEKIKTLKSYISNRVDYIIRKVNDPILFKLKLFSGKSIFPAFDLKNSYDDIKVIDLYTSGLYSEAEKLLPDLLLKKPTQFDLYQLYIKSLIYQKKPFVPFGNPKSVQNSILSDIYTITSVKSNPSQAGLNLLRIANNLSSSILSYGIVDFVNYQTSGKKERQLMARISYNIANPIINEIYIEDTERLAFLEMLSEKFPNSLTINFFKEKLKGTDFLKTYEKKIPKARYKVEYAQSLQKDQNYIDAIPEWEYLLENFSDTTPIYELSLVNLFNAYLKLNRLDDCIKLFVDSYFFNKYIIEKIETDELIQKINSNRFRTINKTIDLPIFYTIVNADEVETHIAFELYNKSLEIKKPSEIFQQSISLINVNNEKLLYYLKNTCSPKILRHSTYIINSKERLEERLAIAYHIKKIDSDNNIDFEIKSIENILVIQQGLIDLDESKIYVNEEGILAGELQEYEAIFERFKVISGIADKNKLLLLERGKLTTFSTEENTEIEKTEYSNNPVFEIYMELFDAVKDKFLNSQFGIVAYLSTRIRHGVLIGELRPIFEKHNLITLKEGKSSSYRRNYYWDLIYSNFSLEKQEQIQILLKDFSSKIDGLIFDLIKKHLQVYKPDINEEGWFNYEFEDNTLWYHSIASIYCKTFSDFVEQAFAVLWQRTDENLNHIRDKILNDILNEFNNHFNELERKLLQHIEPNDGYQLMKSIKDCSTEVQTVMQKISRWFKRSEVKIPDFQLIELINIICEYSNKSNPYKNLEIEKNYNYDLKIKGSLKTHFADLLRIFLENIINHSSEEVNDIQTKISTFKGEDGKLHIDIENEITDKQKLDALKETWEGGKFDSAKLVVEKNSGYHKAFKIMTYDLKNPNADCLLTSIDNEINRFKVSMKFNPNSIVV